MFRDRWYLLSTLFVAMFASVACRSKGKDSPPINPKPRLIDEARITSVAGATLLAATPNGLFVATNDQLYRIKNGETGLLLNLGPAIDAKSSAISAIAAAADSIIVSEVRTIEFSLGPSEGLRRTRRSTHQWRVPQELGAPEAVTVFEPDRCFNCAHVFFKVSRFVTSDQFIYAKVPDAWYRARLTKHPLTFEKIFLDYDRSRIAPIPGENFYYTGGDPFQVKLDEETSTSGIKLFSPSENPKYDFRVDQFVSTNDEIAHLWTRPNVTLGWLTDPPVHLSLAAPGQKVKKISLGLAPDAKITGIAQAAHGTWLLAPTALLYVHDPDPSSQPRIDLQRVVTFTAADQPIQLAALDNDVYILFDTGEIRRYRFSFN